MRKCRDKLNIKYNTVIIRVGIRLSIYDTPNLLSAHHFSFLVLYLSKVKR